MPYIYIQTNGSSSPSPVPPGESYTVKYIKQTLNANQKSQARENIGAAASTDITNINAELQTMQNNIDYEPVKILSFGMTPTKMLIGNTVSSIEFTWNIEGEPSSIKINGVGQTLAKNGSLILSNLNITSNVVYTIEVDDAKKAHDAKTLEIQFLNNVFSGISAVPQNIDSSFIENLDSTYEDELDGDHIFNALADQYIWFCLPARLDKTFKSSNMQGGFSLVDTITYTNENGYQEDYRIYRSDYANLGTTTITIE